MGGGCFNGHDDQYKSGGRALCYYTYLETVVHVFYATFGKA